MLYFESCLIVCLYTLEGSLTTLFSISSSLTTYDMETMTDDKLIRLRTQRGSKARLATIPGECMFSVTLLFLV